MDPQPSPPSLKTIRITTAARLLEGGAVAPESRIGRLSEDRFPADAEERAAFLIHEAEREWELGAFGEAETLFRRAMTHIRSEKLPKSWLALATALLAELHDEYHRTPEAIQLYRSAVELMGDPEGKREPELRYKCTNNLACLLKHLDQYAESEAFFIRAIHQLEETRAHLWEHRATLYNNLGALYHAAGYFEAALDLHRKGLEFALKQTPCSGLLMAETHRNMALASLFCGRMALAVSHLEEARSWAEKVESFREEYLVEVLIAEASTRFRRNDLRTAEDFCLKAISLCQHASRPVSSLLPILYGNLGCVYAKAGLYQQARELFEDAHLMRLSNLSTRDEELRDSHHNLVLISARLGDEENLRRHTERLQKLGGRVPSLSSNATAEQLAARLIHHEPAAFAPPTQGTLGIKPVGIASGLTQ